jgi:hypothetical protein
MALTVQQIDLKIEESRKTLDFWVKAREVVANPLFAELSSAPASGRMTPPPERHYVTQTGEAFPLYGELKRRALQLLSYDVETTPQQLAEAIARTGYTFKTKTPAISVNDTLQTLQAEGKAKHVGKTSSNAGLWIKTEKNYEKTQEKEAAEATP